MSLNLLPIACQDKNLAFFHQPAKPALPVRSDDECSRILSGYRPSYYTATGLVTAVFHKLARLHNGQLGAYYDLRVRDPHTGQTTSTRYLWGIDRSGMPCELKKLSTIIK